MTIADSLVSILVHTSGVRVMLLELLSASDTSK